MDDNRRDLTSITDTPTTFIANQMALFETLLWLHLYAYVSLLSLSEECGRCSLFSVMACHRSRSLFLWSLHHWRWQAAFTGRWSEANVGVEWLCISQKDNRYALTQTHTHTHTFTVKQSISMAWGNPSLSSITHTLPSASTLLSKQVKVLWMISKMSAYDAV